MITQQIRKSGNSLIVTIPKEVVDELDLKEGQTVALEVTPMELKPKLRPEISEILDRTSKRATPVMQYLRDK